MTSDRLQALDEMIARLFRDDSPISTRAESLRTTSVDPPTVDEAVSEASVTEIAGAAENTTTMADQPRSVLERLKYRYGDTSPVGAARYQSQANKIVAHQPGRSIGAD